MKRIVVHLAAVVLALGASAPGWAAEKVVYQLGFLRSGAQANVYYGIKKGLFADEGLDVTVLEGKGALDTMTKVATGAADIGEVTFDVYLASRAEHNIPVKAVMPEYTKPPDSLITTTTSGIKSLKDVGGHKIGTPTFTSSNLMWPVLLKLHGVDPAKVDLIKTQPATLAGMLATGRVDGVILWATSAPKVGPILAKAGKTMHMIRWSESGYEGYGQSLVASDKFIKERPEVLQRFLKVMKESVVAVYKHPAATAALIADMIPQATVKQVQSEIEASKPFIFNEITKRDGLGVYAPARVKTSWEWVAKANKYPMDKLDPMTMVDSDFVAD